MPLPSEYEARFKSLGAKRAGFRGRITAALRNLDKVKKDDLTEEIFASRKQDVLHYLGKVDDTNDEIISLFDMADLGEHDEFRVLEMDKQVSYRVTITDKLAGIAAGITKQSKPPPKSDNKAVKMPELKCQTFSGESLDKFEFKNFLQQFQNCIDACTSLTNTGKLTYLRSYLTDYAFTTISHLSITNDNYDVAIQILKKEFLDEEFIVDEILKQLLEGYPKFDVTFGEVKSYINVCRAHLYELKTYGVDLLEVNSAGCKLISHILFSKLPVSLKKELIHKVDTNYPTVVDLFDNYNDLIKTLLRTSSRNKSDNKDNSVKPKTWHNGKAMHFSSNIKPASTLAKPSTLENFETSITVSSDKKFCKFCAAHGHTMVSCSKYGTVEARKNRCKELKLCNTCSSNKHLSDKCPGKDNKMSFPCYFCKTHSHISALCHLFKVGKSMVTSLCINMSSLYQPFLLPVVTLTFQREGNTHCARCLLDDGSYRSYLSPVVTDGLQCDTDNWTQLNYDVKTFLGSKKRSFKECMIDVGIPGRKALPLPMLIDKDFDIQLHVTDLPLAVANITAEGFKLADPFIAEHGEVINVQGLLGVDIIQFFPNMQKVSCMNGSAWMLDTGIVPFGNVMHFLKPSQIARSTEPFSTVNDCTTTSIKFVEAVELYGSEDASTYVNFVLEPKKTYFTPLEESFPDSLIEQGLENMFSLESVGCSEISNDQSLYDTDKIEAFKSKIQFADNRYSVALPWHDMVTEVPSNENVAIAILEKVVNKLKRNGLLDVYRDVFAKQLEDNIIERIDITPETFHEHVWIPHRPVVKTDPNSTTKVRPVFNCSLKVNNKPSLNEAAYAGVNLMNDLTKLVLYFRSNKYVMISDIKQAFLQISLANEQDKNRFSFFMIENDQLVAYRYRTIIFGFNASPFILNYVIKHHASQYPDDECSHILKFNFYVDNLLITGNSIEKLNHLYNECGSRMKKGGFFLRSWNSNSEELRNNFLKDDVIVQHGNDYEKVLGYKYLVNTDELQIAGCDLDSSVETKRSILSQISKVFDPLGLYLPVTTRGKILMRDLWSQQLSWDEIIPEQNKQLWSKLCHDLVQLPCITFPRNCIDSEASDNCLYIFCDASKLCYGFTVYNVCNGNSQLVYAKAKVAPQKKKSLPTLELMSVYLAMKCLPFIMDAYNNIKFKCIYIAVDSQVVLSWLVGNTVKTKNVFARNRIKDIAAFKESIFNTYQIDISYNFINSEHNPADLLTRGLSFKEFEKQIDFWSKGPLWLRSVPVSWPDSSLDCLSEESKQIVNMHNETCALNVQESVHSPLFDINKYSTLNRLFGLTEWILRFVFNCRKVDSDPMEAGKLYWIKCMQKSKFHQELQYLENKSSNSNKIPELVNRLDLFLDDHGIIRSRGRIGKTAIYDFDIVNPILLAKDHHLTTLIVESYHKRCKHLGIQSTLNAVRMGGFWIPRMRQSVKKILSNCMVCIKFNSFSFRYPKMTNLPKHRVNLVKPFNHTGVDYTSHLWVKNESSDEYVKMYLLIFTCLNVRAVHIEIVPDMTTHSFILAFLRFVNLYGVPSSLYSDNAKTFSAGGDLLQQFMITDEFSSNFQNFNIKHIQIPTYSAWVGSTWERLIRTIKSCLYKTIGRSKLTYFELLTVIGDIQSAVNSRPLTYRSTDDDLEIITPNSFLRFNTNPFLLLRQSDDSKLWEVDPPSRDSLVETLELRNEIFSHFKDLWYSSYLLGLREHYRELHERTWNNRVKAGDVVLIKLPKRPRPYWLLGRVTEVIIGHDNKIRSVKVKRGDGLVAHHSINHLYPMELSLTHAYNDSSVSSDNFDDEQVGSKAEVEDCELQANDEPVGFSNSDPISSIEVADHIPSDIHVNARPRRAAAKACEGRMRKWCQRLTQ